MTGGLMVLVLTLLLPVGQALAAQVCKYNSIAATAPASRFNDNRDGTVTDRATGLQWKRCSEGQTWSSGTCTGTAGGYNWQLALQRADAATDAGKSGWRLPNIQELVSIVEEACYDPAIDLAVFPGTSSYVYWSSSPYAYTSAYAWLVYFSLGYDGLHLQVQRLPGSVGARRTVICFLNGVALGCGDGDARPSPALIVDSGRGLALDTVGAGLPALAWRRGRKRGQGARPRRAVGAGLAKL